MQDQYRRFRVLPPTPRIGAELQVSNVAAVSVQAAGKLRHVLVDHQVLFPRNPPLTAASS